MAIASTETVEDIQDTVANVYLDDIEHKVWSQKALYHAIREAAQSVYTEMGLVAPSMITDTVVIPYDGVTVEYNLPSDFWLPLRVRVEVAGTPPTSYTMEVFDFSASGKWTGEGAYFRDDQIGIFAVGTINTIRLDYIKSFTWPTALADTLNMPDRWIPLITLRAAINLRTARNMNSRGLDIRYEQILESLQIADLNYDTDTNRSINMVPFNS